MADVKTGIPADPATNLRTASLAVAGCSAMMAGSLYLASAPASLFPAIAPVVAHTATTANVAMLPEAVTVLGARMAVLMFGLMTPFALLAWVTALSAWRSARKSPATDAA